MPLERCLPPFNSEEQEDEKCQPYANPSNISLFKNFKSGFGNVFLRTQLFETTNLPNIEHELNVAKSLLQQCSEVTGDNLFDHLADIIKVVMRENPENIVDYFEEFSHNIRQQKFRNPERVTRKVYEPPNVHAAKSLLCLLKVPYVDGVKEYDVCTEERFSKATFQSSKLKTQVFCKLLLNENVLRLHLYWALCGFGIETNEVQHLACSLQKLRCHMNVEHCRFWGKIYGLTKSYYIAEVNLTPCELRLRLEKMKKEMTEMLNVFRTNSEQNVTEIEDSELVPGVQWRDQLHIELNKMRLNEIFIPKPKTEIKFDVPPEAVGMGLNRRTYFVVNCLDDDWIELPIVTPKQIQVSRKIKKFLTGDLEADIVSYPRFPGTEKHYLRAMISRITSGTYVAPNGYYRKLTKEEEMKALGFEIEGKEKEEMELFGEEEEEGLSNDAMITENCKYEPLAAERLMKPMSWVHTRPNILEQGRVVYFDEEEARKALERDFLLRDVEKYKLIEEEEDELEEEMDENDFIEDDTGPALFTTCSEDINSEGVMPWTAKYSSVHNKVNQLVILRSNLWPGAYSFTFDKYSDSIYMGWGYKYIARNTTVPHMPCIQNEYTSDSYNEVTDPAAKMEISWELYEMRNKRRLEVCFEDEEYEEEEQETCV